MKTYIYLFVLLLSTGLYAQQKPVEEVTETKTKIKTITFNKSGDAVKNKVRVRTTKERVLTEETNVNTSSKSKANQPKVKVTKTVNIDNNKDPYYESTATIEYYILNNDTYKFKSDNNGFTIFKKNKDPFAMARRSSNGQFYLLTMDKYAGVGYFDEDSNFVIEYINSETGMNLEETFEVGSDK